MIRFKTLKLKHNWQAQTITQKIDKGEADEHEILEFILSLVEVWDFTDAETGEPLPLEIRVIGELSLEQYQTLMTSFNNKMGIMDEAPKKKSDEPLPSGSIKSKAARRSQYSRRNGPATS